MSRQEGLVFLCFLSCRRLTRARIHAYVQKAPRCGAFWLRALIPRRGRTRETRISYKHTSVHPYKEFLLAYAMHCLDEPDGP